MGVSDPPTDFFHALTLLSRDWDERVRVLSVQTSALGPGDVIGGSEPAELAEDMLEAVQAMAQRVPQVQTQLRRDTQDLHAFLDASRLQWQDLLRELAQYEQWAGQYGYTPQLDASDVSDPSTWSWDQILADYSSARPHEPASLPDSEEAESAPPTIFESGVSQGALQALGYTFKEPIPDPVWAGTDASPPPPAVPPSAPPSAGTHRSLALTSDEEDSGPLPIMKKPAPLAVTPDPLSRLGDQSRVEITPGLFVRKPKTKSADPPPPPSRHMVPSGLPPEFHPIEDALTPQRPALTVDIQRILAQARLAEPKVPPPPAHARTERMMDELKPQYPVAKSPYGQRWSRLRDNENVQPASLQDPDDLTPEMPNLSSKKGQQLAHMSAQKPPTRPHVSESGASLPSNSDLAASPGPPQRPQLQSEALGQIRDRVW